MAPIEAEWLGSTHFRATEALQFERREMILSGQASEVIWGTEHHPVIVTGMRAPPPSDMPDLDWLRREGIPVRESKRGGLATYHGPGQLMLYCLVDLKRHRMSVPRFVTLLEGCVIDWLIDVGVSGRRQRGAPGIWVDGLKICSIGLHFRRWVSMYGLALNLNPDLRIFKQFRPCGYSGSDVTSLVEQKGTLRDPSEVWKEISTKIACSIDRNPVDSFCGRGYPPCDSGT